MTGGMVIGFISIGLLLILNLVGIAFSYGKMTQRVKNLCTRLDNHIAHDTVETQKTVDDINLRLGRIEGRIGLPTRDV